MNELSVKNNSIARSAAGLICLAAAAVICLISLTVYRASLPNMLIAAAFFIFYVQIPGLYLIRLAGFRNEHISTTLALGVFAGWAFDVLAYFINDLLPGNLALYIAAPALSVLYAADIARGKQQSLLRSRFHLSRLSPALCIFMLLVLFYCVASVQYNYMSPAVADFTIMNSDKAYHIGLINSLSHDYPMESPWVSGRFITYHIFSEILLSIPVRLFSVPADFIMLSSGPLWTTYTFGLAAYSFFREMSTVPQRAGIYSLILLLSNIYITRDPQTSLAFKFALENDNSSGYGVASMLVTITAFKKWYGAFRDDAPEKTRYLAVLVFFVMLVTGIKGPMGAVIIAAAWGTMLLGVIMRKLPLKSLLPLIITSAGFAFIYKTVLNGRGTSNATGQSIFAFAKIVDIAFWKKPLIGAMKAMGLGTPLRLGIVMLVFLAFFFTVFFLPFCVGYIRELILVLSGRKAFEPHRVLVYAACAVGFILMMIMNYAGHSQVYFGLVTVFLSPAVAFWFIEDLELKRDCSKHAGLTLRFMLIVMALTLAATSVSFAAYLGERVEGAVKATNIHRTPNQYMSISRDEYEAMLWLNENTDEDALLATDRYYSVAPDKYCVDNRWHNRFFLYSDYSNRFTYISGSGYNIPDSQWELRREMVNTNKQLYDPENEERGELARELGVDYVVVSRRFGDPGDLSSADYEKCYSNDDIEIYKIAG